MQKCIFENEKPGSSQSPKVSSYLLWLLDLIPIAHLARQTIAIRALDHDHTEYWGKSEEAFDFIGIILTRISVIVDIGKIFCHE